MSEVIFVTAGMLSPCVPAALIRICGVAPTGIRVLQNRRAVRRVFSIALRPARSSELGENAIGRYGAFPEVAITYESRIAEVRVLPPFKFQGDARRRCFRKECTAPPRCSASAPPASSSRSTRSTCAGAVRIGQSREGERRESEAPPPHTAHTHTHTDTACSSQCTHSRRDGHAQQILACSHFADRGPPGGRRRL